MDTPFLQNSLYFLGLSSTLRNAVRYTEAIGDGSATSIAVTHSIGRQFISAQIFYTSTPFEQVECEVEMTSTTVTTFVFNVAPTRRPPALPP